MASALKDSRSFSTRLFGLQKINRKIKRSFAGVNRTLFAELDGDNSGTIDEAEFGKLLAAMALDVQPGQFASIDKVRPNILFFF